MPSIKKLFLRRRTEGTTEKDGPSSPISKQLKHASIRSQSEGKLLDGKYEAVPAVGDASFLKSGSVLQLQLDLTRRDLNIEDVVDDESLAERKLKPDEALRLMRACAPIITSRGLEMLGIMHPHWHSASPAAQRKIISLFLRTLDSSGEDATKNKTAATSAFESELEYSHSPHDVAAVFRWALRHLVLEETSFGNETVGGSPLTWYDNFVIREREKSFPRTAFNELLDSVVKESHAALLRSTLDLASSLASHSEMNGMSGSKLSMFLGHYLLTGNRVEDSSDWLSFYAQWERAGRALEHIFLAFLRNEEARFGVPRRLAELIATYPYAAYTNNEPFARPGRFATRSYDALYVQITSEIHIGTKVGEEERSPLRVLESALKAEVGEEEGEEKAFALWEQFKNSATSVGDLETSSEKLFSKVFSDDTMRLLTLEKPKELKQRSTEDSKGGSRGLGVSVSANGKGGFSSTSLNRDLSRQVSLKSTEVPRSPITTDWGLFSSSGFGESSAGQSLAATLLDADVEKTDPPRNFSRRPTLRKSRSRSRRRASPTHLTREPAAAPPPLSSESVSFRVTNVSHVKLDEAFVDFWSDALLDSVTAAWPAFVVCQLRSNVSLQSPETNDKIVWLIVEQKFVEQRPHFHQYADEPLSPTHRASSPRPSARSADDRHGIVGRVSSTFSVTSRRRFNPFGVSSTESREKLSKGVGQVKEIGEVISEEGQVISRKYSGKFNMKGLKDKRLSFIPAGMSISMGSKSPPANKSEYPKEQSEASEGKLAARPDVLDTGRKVDDEVFPAKPEVAKASSSAQVSCGAETNLTDVESAPGPLNESIPAAATREVGIPAVVTAASAPKSDANIGAASAPRPIHVPASSAGALASGSLVEEVDPTPHAGAHEGNSTPESTTADMGATLIVVDAPNSSVTEVVTSSKNEEVKDSTIGGVITSDGDELGNDTVQQVEKDGIAAAESGQGQESQMETKVPEPADDAAVTVNVNSPPSIGHTSTAKDASTVEKSVTESPPTPFREADITVASGAKDA